MHLHVPVTHLAFLWCPILIGPYNISHNRLGNPNCPYANIGWFDLLTPFFWHMSRKVIFMKGRWPIWKKPKHVQGWNWLMGVRPMNQKNMLWRCWFVCSGARPMESCRWSQGSRRGSRLYENLDDSVVVFKVVYLQLVFSLDSSNVCRDRLGLDSARL